MLIEDKALMWFLGLYLTLISPLEKIWPFSQATFSKRLESILKFLTCVGAFPAAGCEKERYTPQSVTGAPRRCATGGRMCCVFYINRSIKLSRKTY